MEEKVETVILASASPRRTELLTQAGIAHIIIPSDCPEVIKTNVPQDVVMDLALQKAEDVYHKYQSRKLSERFMVIGADTVVAQNGKILGKPKGKEEAFEMLSLLQGNTHQVYTGVAIIRCKNGSTEKTVFYERSNVHVYPISDQEMHTYIASGEPLDKAGAYGIQGSFAVHIRAIEGDYNNIVGLPIARIYQQLKEFPVIP